MFIKVTSRIFAVSVLATSLAACATTAPTIKRVVVTKTIVVTHEILVPANMPLPDLKSCPEGGMRRFATLETAREVCGADFVVWVNLSGRSKLYHFPEGETDTGAFTCIREAKACGFRATRR